jgi:ABC-type Mn2+/Zn2+ transport system permease subunit
MLALNGALVADGPPALIRHPGVLRSTYGGHLIEVGRGGVVLSGSCLGSTRTFMQRALLASVLEGGLTALVGVSWFSGGWHSSATLMSLLFGNVLAVSSTDLVFVGARSVLVVGPVGVTYRELIFATFDPLGARAAG